MHIPNAKTGQADDVASLVSYLASPQAHFVTGELILFVLAQKVWPSSFLIVVNRANHDNGWWRYPLSVFLLSNSTKFAVSLSSYMLLSFLMLYRGTGTSLN